MNNKKPPESPRAAFFMRTGKATEDTKFTESEDTKFTERPFLGEPCD